MNNIGLGQAISILANLGVIAGIFFLVIEIRQTNDAMNAQARFNRLSVQTGSQTIIADSPQLAEVIAKVEGGIGLTPGEQVQYAALYGRAIANIYWSWSELPVSELPVNAYRQVLNRPGVREIWDAAKADFDSNFVSFVEVDVLGK